MDQEDDVRYSNMVSTVTFRRVSYSTTSDPRKALVLYHATARPTTVSDDKGIDFLGFPREIRDEIYSHIFVKATRIGAESKFTKPFWRDAIRWRNHSLAGTCRQIWNESLVVYLLRNGFEFYYIRPFLEFLEKIGLRGRRLLTDVQWYHHARSRPFIVIRLLRSCTNLRNLEVSARVRVKERPGFQYKVPFLHARRFFLANYSRISFGDATPFGTFGDAEEAIPDLRLKLVTGEYEQRALRTLSENLKKVKWEIAGKYKRYVPRRADARHSYVPNVCNRYDLPSIWMNGMCHWKYQMLDDLKKKRKQEADEEAQQANVKRQKTECGGVAEERRDVTGLGVQSTHVQPSPEDTTDGSTQLLQISTPRDGIDEESIDKDDGYTIKEGNLLKDGILVATGEIFDDDNMVEEAVVSE